MTNEMINASDNALVNEELEMYNQRLGSFNNLEDGELSKEELEALLGTDTDDIEEENSTEGFRFASLDGIYNNNGKPRYHIEITFAASQVFPISRDIISYGTGNNILSVTNCDGTTENYPLFNILVFKITNI